MDEINRDRRDAIQKSIQSISAEEVKSLGEGLFPYLDDPWREKFFTFIAENPDATFHHATTHDRIHILYCHAKETGIWFRPGGGMGPLQAKGRAALKEIVEANR
jgi:hypothetical protein